MSFTKVSLEGDFLEAFLYSGILFTVDTDGILSTCSFKNLINRVELKGVWRYHHAF